MASCIRRMLERNVEGVAVMTFGIEQPLLDELANARRADGFYGRRPGGAAGARRWSSTITRGFAKACSIWLRLGTAS